MRAGNKSSSPFTAHPFTKTKSKCDPRSIQSCIGLSLHKDISFGWRVAVVLLRGFGSLESSASWPRSVSFPNPQKPPNIQADMEINCVRYLGEKAPTPGASWWVCGCPAGTFCFRFQREAALCVRAADPRRLQVPFHT